ncbi:vWA domain-containing protein [Huintestinicola sp.]|uniref:vWA domain-containing protein n=1 Tax=Huintestinicola sp. TaxID=2981661 RepID=UPI003D7CE9FD
MKKDLTEIVFILDESGSMFGLKSDTIGGFNSLIEKQKSEKGKAVVSTVLFSTQSRVLHDRVPLERIGKMTDRDYRPGGCTALLDAVGEAVHHIGNVHKYARSEDVPERTVFIINTDGMENASRNYTVSKVKKMISRQQEKYGWEFVFLGANIDAAETAESIGIRRENAVDCCADSVGCAVQYEAMSAAVSGVRKGVKLSQSAEWRRNADKDHSSRKR